MTILTPITSRFYALRSYAAGLAWSPLLQLSRGACLSLFGKVELGRLEIVDCDGETVICGQDTLSKDAPKATLRIHKDTFWVRLLLFADMVCWSPL